MRTSNIWCVPTYKRVHSRQYPHILCRVQLELLDPRMQCSQYSDQRESGSSVGSNKIMSSSRKYQSTTSSRKVNNPRGWGGTLAQGGNSSASPTLPLYTNRHGTATIYEPTALAVTAPVPVPIARAESPFVFDSDHPTFVTGVTSSEYADSYGYAFRTPGECGRSNVLLRIVRCSALSTGLKKV